MKTINATSFVLLLLMLCGVQGCGSPDGEQTHAGDDGHGHAAQKDEHDRHDDEGDGEHDDEVVRLTPAQLTEAGVVIEPLSDGVITTHVTLPAEVGLNQDALLHVTPRVPGIVTEVRAFLGDDVVKGTILAVIQSPQLGEAKIAYLQTVQSNDIAAAELRRQQTISKNTATLLGLLRAEPAVDDLHGSTSELSIGENKGRLISAYAKLNAAEANYARERELRSKNLSTESDLLAAQEAYNSSQADYFAVFEDIDFTYRLRLQEAERSASVARSSVENAERRLHILGLGEDQVANISDEPDTNVARYELRAPIAGRIIEKHITPGEAVDNEEAIYTVANLDTVWLNISVYTEYAGLIREGLSVKIHAGDRFANGTIDYVSSVVSETTRTVSARVVVDNEDGAWKPGDFVTARVETGEVRVDRVVPIEAIQTFEGRSVVFVQHADGIVPVPVELGRRNDVSVELTGGEPEIGSPIVVKNSFLMKAELGKSAAGHDH